MKLLALDPSTDITGAALLNFEGGSLTPLALFAHTGKTAQGKPGNTASLRMQRIADTREALMHWLLSVPAFDAVGYEWHTGRGGASSEAIAEAIGAYLSIPQVALVPLIRVVPSQAKAAWNGNRLERKEAKIQVVRWARQEFRVDLCDTDDAKADALAVGVAAWALLQKQCQTSMSFKGRR